MAIEQTLSIIKPDAVARHVIGGIYDMLEKNALHIIAAKLKQLSLAEAGEFYAEHNGKFFFQPLVEYMASGPVMVQVLSGEDAIARYRQLMGATDPAAAEPGTIRNRFATVDKESNVQKNAVHGSDSIENARREIDFFFTAEEIFQPAG